MTRIVKYVELWDKLQQVIHKENHLLSNMAIISAEIYQAFKFHWVGFYLVDNIKNELYLGPYQGPLPCSKINYGKGVCGSAWKNRKTYLVDDVHQFPGHIACSALSNSEIVVPLILNNEVIAVFDIDSSEYSDFTKTDQLEIEKIISHLGSVTIV